jgi:hypothetical protein
MSTGSPTRRRPSAVARDRNLGATSSAGSRSWGPRGGRVAWCLTRAVERSTGSSSCHGLCLAQSCHAAMRTYASGEAYHNYADPDLADWQNAYYGRNYSALQCVKAAVNPTDSGPRPAGAR